MLRDHKRDLSSAKESVTIFGLSAPPSDLSLEVRILNNFLRCGSPRIKRLEVREWSSKIDRDVLGSSTEVAVSTSLFQRIASDR